MVNCSVEDSCLASGYVARLYSIAVKEFERTSAERIDLLAAHGQTLAHVPPSGLEWDGIPVAGSLQVLNGGQLAQETGIPVAYDFRVRDIAVGGQGAPLVPFGDLVFFGDVSPTDLGVLNIGGIANLTVIRKASGTRVTQAFDTGPGNMLMDAWASKVSNGVIDFDDDGRMAREGTTCRPLLDHLLSDRFFHRPPPKSTGRDEFGENRLEAILAGETGFTPRTGLTASDMMSTLLDLTVVSIVSSLKKFVFPDGRLPLLITAGGGALNSELVFRLQKEVGKDCQVVLSDRFGVPVFAREAMAFSALGDSLVRNRFSNVPAATGAREPVVLGSFAPGTSGV